MRGFAILNLLARATLGISIILPMRQGERAKQCNLQTYVLRVKWAFLQRPPEILKRIGNVCFSSRRRDFKAHHALNAKALSNRPMPRPRACLVSELKWSRVKLLWSCRHMCFKSLPECYHSLPHLGKDLGAYFSILSAISDSWISNKTKHSGVISALTKVQPLIRESIRAF